MINHSEGASRIKNEIVGPLGLGILVVIATLGILAVASPRIGVPAILIVIPGALALTAGLMVWVGSIVDSVASRPLARVRAAMQEMEGGDYGTRVKLEAPLELQELAQGFNRMATIVGHQRERLKVLAATDGLTGLANHRHFHERLRAEIQSSRDNDVPLAVVALDIDGFKQLNDLSGHARGDEALRAAGDALTGTVRASDLVARLGGDDFILLLLGADSAYAREVGDRSRAAIARCLPGEPRLTVSAGFVCFPDSAGEESNFAELATSALDVAKRAGGDQTRKYDPDQVAAIPTVKQQRAEIDELLGRGQPITPVFQPLVELATGRLIGFEALSRFNSEQRRPPDAWFNQAHACGRGPQLEAEAIRAALSAPQRPQGTYLSLNFSPSALSSSHVLGALPPRLDNLMIEITEHELAAEDGGLEDGLAQLRARGARIAVDDAGAGYAGLNQVMRVQPDVIKLDRSLVQGVDHDPAKSALIEFFVLFARRVGAGVCSEGIETIEELRALVNLGVSFGQGYLLGRPAEPWSSISPEILRALSTGALRDHARSGVAVPVQLGAPAQARRPTPVGAPVNRRLGRYISR
ncbi:MAG: hypothetical protein NVSMB25_21210 [Thermoleophilaceae bacterium]